MYTYQRLLAHIYILQNAQNSVAEHIEGCRKQKGSVDTRKTRGLRSRKQIVPTIPPKGSPETVRKRINLRVRLSDGTYFQNPQQAQKSTEIPPVRPTLSSIATKLPQTATEYGRVIREIEEFELLPKTQDIFRQLTGEREVHSDSDDSMPDAYEYDPEDDHSRSENGYFMKTPPVSVFQARVQESFKRSYAHAFAEQENIIAVMHQLQTEYLELEEEVAAREHRMPKRLRPLDSPIVFEDKKEADLYNYKYDPDPKKRGIQDPDTQRTDSVYVGGRELRGRARNRDGPLSTAEFLQGRKRRGPAPATLIPRPAGTRGPGRPPKVPPAATDSGMTSLQPSRDASIDATTTPHDSPARKAKVIRNPRGYNGRNKPEPTPTVETREPTPEEPAPLPKRRGRKPASEKNKQPIVQPPQSSYNEKFQNTQGIVGLPKENPESKDTVVQPSFTETKTRAAWRQRQQIAAGVSVQVADDSLSPPPTSAPEKTSEKTTAAKSATKSATKSTAKPAVKPAWKPAGMKPPPTKPAGRKREIVKLRLSSGASARAGQILSPTLPDKRQAPVVEKGKGVEFSMGRLNPENAPSYTTGPTAPAAFYGDAIPSTPGTPVTPSPPAVAKSASTTSSGNSPKMPETIPTPTISSSSPQAPLHFMPSRMASSPAASSPVTTPVPASLPRQFFGNASRRARRGEFINSGKPQSH